MKAEPLHIQRWTRVEVRGFSATLDHTAGKARFCALRIEDSEGSTPKALETGVDKAELQQLILALSELCEEMHHD